jgi:4-nitrophenyl phosphatase
MSAKPISAAEITQLCQGLLLDSYGVLVNSAGALDGAAAFIGHLNERRFPYAVVTNDASRTPESISRWYTELGFSIAPPNIISSGLLVAEYVADQALAGARARVLGPADSIQMMKDAGLEVIPLGDTEAEAEVVVLCDEAGYPFLRTLDYTLSMIWRRQKRGEQTHLLLPNPDRVYPRSSGSLGLGAGAVAAALESALAAALPDRAGVHFIPLGKPHAPIFERAKSALGQEPLCMVGDQLETDIAGAKNAGLLAALVGTGVLDLASSQMDPAPDFLLPSLAL